MEVSRASLIVFAAIGFIAGTLVLCFIAAIVAIILLLHTKKSTCAPAPPPEISDEQAAARATLGECIKNHRIRCNMTQEFVADSLGVTRQAVSKWERGESDPSTSNLLALAKLFSVSAQELLSEVV